MKVQVIEKKKGRINRTTGEEIKGNLRVCAYARVSTEKEEQINSYNSQLKYYEEKIKSNSDWKYVGIYADEGITGTLDYRRDGFMKMMQDATQNKFDMIITKSISRFGRNTVDTLKYVRLLKEKGIAIYFEEERINTLEISGEIMLTVLSAMAQQESENISSHVKLGLQMKQKRGELIGYNGCLGYVYDKDTKEIAINYEEAEIVRYIFERYCQGVGCTTIAKELTNMKYKTPTGKKKWHESTIRGILKNEKYKGDVLQGKTYTTDPISHRRVVNMGEENQYYIQEHHEPIISERMFNQVQEILQKRGGVRGSGRRKGNFSRKYPFSSRLYCGFCGSLLTRRNWHSGTKNSITVWHCMEFVKQGKENCPHCKAMKENIIEEAFTESYKLLCNNNKELIQTFLNEMEEIIQEESNESSIKKLEEEKQILKEKIDKLIDLNLNGTITLETLQEKKAKLQNKINNIEKEQEHLQLELEDSMSLNQGLNKFKTLFKDNEIMPEFDIISQEKENELTVFGTTRFVKNKVCVFIGGGGSTEIAMYDNGIKESVNTKIGVIDLMQEFPDLAENIATTNLETVKRFIKERLNLPKEKADILILAGGGHEKFARHSGIKYEENTLYKDVASPIMMDIETRKSETERYYEAISLDEIRNRVNDPDWWYATRAMSAFTLVVAEEIGAKYIVPTDIAMVYGILEQGVNR